MRQDLRLFEINVQTARLYTPPAPQTARVIMPVIIMPQQQAPQAAAPETPRAETPAGTAGHEEPERKLPKTASPLPLIALLGAFFVAAAVALRALRSMTGRVQL